MTETPTMQPIILDSEGAPRFRPNSIVEWLVKESGGVDLNRVARTVLNDADRFPIEDVEQFWQMLGYSVSGYGDLSFVRPTTLELADDAANKLLYPMTETETETKRDDGGPAFPFQPISNMAPASMGAYAGAPSVALPVYSEPQAGMTLRDWLAGQVLAGMQASLRHRDSWLDQSEAEVAARFAVIQADALIAELAK